LALWGEIRRRAKILNLGTGLGETDIDAFLGGTAVNIGNEHGWVVSSSLLDNLLLLGGALLGAAGNSDGCTVHVHFTVTNSVEPGPGESVLASLDVRRHIEVEYRVVIAREIAIRLGWAATFVGLDDLPLGVLGRLTVGGQTDLAGATAVDGTALESQLLRCTLGNDILLGDLESVRTKLAGEVASISRQRRVVERILAVWDRVAHDHVGVDHGCAENSSGQRLGEHHDGYRICFFYRFD
jgi:hypothetical protein